MNNQIESEKETNKMKSWMQNKMKNKWKGEGSEKRTRAPLQSKPKSAGGRYPVCPSGHFQTNSASSLAQI